MQKQIYPANEHPVTVGAAGELSPHELTTRTPYGARKLSINPVFQPYPYLDSHLALAGSTEMEGPAFQAK